MSMILDTLMELNESAPSRSEWGLFPVNTIGDYTILKSVEFDGVCYMVFKNWNENTEIGKYIDTFMTEEDAEKAIKSTLNEEFGTQVDDKEAIKYAKELAKETDCEINNEYKELKENCAVKVNEEFIPVMDVVISNISGELSRQAVSSTEELRKYLNSIVDAIEPGDIITFENGEMEV